MLDRLTADSFAPFGGTAFVVDGAPGDPINLVLRSVRRYPIQPHAPRPEPFSLELVGPPAPLLPQAVYALDHPELGRLELFMVPLGPDRDGGMLYEIVFN